MAAPVADTEHRWLAGLEILDHMGIVRFVVLEDTWRLLKDEEGFSAQEIEDKFQAILRDENPRIKPYWRSSAEYD